MLQGLHTSNINDNPFIFFRSPSTKAQSSLKKIISNISRLQDEKSKLSTKYENAVDEIERLKCDAKLKEETDAKISQLSSPRRVTVGGKAKHPNRTVNCVSSFVEITVTDGGSY